MSLSHDLNLSHCNLYSQPLSQTLTSTNSDSSFTFSQDTHSLILDSAQYNTSSLSLSNGDDYFYEITILLYTTMFEIVHGLIVVLTSSLISVDPQTKCNRPYKFKVQFFFPRTIPQWNETAEATTINCFKCRLH